MLSMFKWFKNSAKCKRWMLLILVGILFLCHGIANLMVNKELSTAEIIFVVISFVVGIVSVVLGMLFMQRRILEMVVEESDTRSEGNNVNSLIFNKKVYNQGPKIVVIGGGTGLNTVLRGLKNYTDNITAIVTVSDYGETPTNSRKQLKVLPLEDIQSSLAALAMDEDKMEKLLNVEFKEGQLSGLSFGDIYFLAMNNMYGNFQESIERSGEVLNMTGKVIPVTLEPIDICAELEDGTVVKTRDKIPDEVQRTGNKIGRIFVSPTNVKPTPGVIEAIKDADAIIIGPGSLYTNVIPNLLVNGIAKAIKESKAFKVYVSNIMTEYGQTDEYTLSDHLKAITDYVGKGIVDYCIYDTGEIIPEYIHKYNLKGADIVIPDTNKCKELGVNLVQRDLSKVDSDGEHVIHDPDVIATAIIQLVCDELEFDDMQNDSQFMMLNNKLKQTKRELRKQARKDKKFKKSGKKQFTPNKKGFESKFGEKYKERIDSIQETDSTSTEQKILKREKKKKEDLLKVVSQIGMASKQEREEKEKDLRELEEKVETSSRFGRRFEKDEKDEKKEVKEEPIKEVKKTKEEIQKEEDEKRHKELQDLIDKMKEL